MDEKRVQYLIDALKVLDKEEERELRERFAYELAEELRVTLVH